MDIIEQWGEILEQILQYHANLPYRYGYVSTYVVLTLPRINDGGFLVL